MLEFLNMEIYQLNASKCGLILTILITGVLHLYKDDNSSRSFPNNS